MLHSQMFSRFVTEQALGLFLLRGPWSLFFCHWYVSLADMTSSRFLMAYSWVNQSPFSPWNDMLPRVKR